MHKTDIDPDLERQLAAAREDEPVEVVLLLREPEAGERPADAGALLERVCGKSADAVELNYMPRIRALVVRARPQVIRQLISQPEVEMASANRLEGDEGL
jgi:hypothetical protein